jgi:hypothetical protein
MDKIIDAINELVLSNQQQTKLMQQELQVMKEHVKNVEMLVVETKKQAEAAKKQAEASWELVVITRNQVTEEIAYLKKPFWKKIMGSKP